MEPISLSRDNEVSPATAADEDGLYLHLSNPCVVGLPEEGLITFRYRRGDLHLVKGESSKAYTDLNLTEIVDVKAEEEKDDKDSESDKFDALFKQAIKEDAE